MYNKGIYWMAEAIIAAGTKRENVFYPLMNHLLMELFPMAPGDPNETYVDSDDDDYTPDPDDDKPRFLVSPQCFDINTGSRSLPDFSILVLRKDLSATVLSFMEIKPAHFFENSDLRMAADKQMRERMEEYAREDNMEINNWYAFSFLGTHVAVYQYDSSTNEIIPAKSAYAYQATRWNHDVTTDAGERWLRRKLNEMKAVV